MSIAKATLMALRTCGVHVIVIVQSLNDKDSMNEVLFSV